MSSSITCWGLLAVCLAIALLTNLAAGAGPSTAPATPAGAGPALRLISREVFIPSPGPGVRAEGQTFYTKASGLQLLRYSVEQSKSDKMDSLLRSFSEDNGKTWSTEEKISVVEKIPEGTRRKGFKAGWVDPVNGLLLIMGGQGVRKNDHPLEVSLQANLWYYVSNDGGHTFIVSEPVIQQGEQYSREHPLEGVWQGKNTAGYGDRVGRPIRTRGGRILQPLQITLPGEGGKPANPGGGYTYTEVAVLIGQWREDGHIDWQLSQRVANTPDRSSRGAIEPTIAQLPDGRILMVMRGSDTKTTPGYKWYSLSADEGMTWSPIAPWTYADGQSFYSPSSCAQLLPHSNGRIYWLGNIVPAPPKGNSPRYPFVIGEVDPASGLLLRDSVVVIDNRGKDDQPQLMLSNFIAREDRATSEIILHMSRPFATSGFTSDAYLYRIAVGP